MPTSWRATRAGLASGPIRLKIVRRPSALRIGMDPAHRRVVLAGEQEADAEVGERLLGGSPARSRSSPSASSVSAAPALDEAARLPCLATGTPQAATTSATAVETLSVWCPSPPVPQTSIALAGRVDRDQPRAHRPRRAGDLGGGLAAVGQRDEEARRSPRPAARRRASRRTPPRPRSRRAARSTGGSAFMPASRSPRSRRARGSWRAARGRARWRCSRGGTGRRGSAASRGGSP